MAHHHTWLLVILLGICKILGAVVLPRPPSSEVRGQNSVNLVIVTSSELPKQIPAPTQPLTHSSTPQYHEVEQQVAALPQFKLLWITREMDSSVRHTPSHRS
ncbi:hypothetical protein L9F63_009306, partial [Diploptera punctata]